MTQTFICFPNSITIYLPISHLLNTVIVPTVMKNHLMKNNSNTSNHKGQRAWKDLIEISW